MRRTWRMAALLGSLLPAVAACGELSNDAGYERARRVDTIGAYADFLGAPYPGRYENIARERIAALLAPLRQVPASGEALDAHVDAVWNLLGRQLPTSRYRWSIESKSDLLACISAAVAGRVPCVFGFGPATVQRHADGGTAPYAVGFIELAGHACVLDGYCETYQLAQPVTRKDELVTGYQTDGGYAEHAAIAIGPFGFQVTATSCGGHKGWLTDVPEQHHRIDYFRGGQERTPTVTVTHTDLAFK